VVYFILAIVHLPIPGVFDKYGYTRAIIRNFFYNLAVFYGFSGIAQTKFQKVGWYYRSGRGNLSYPPCSWPVSWQPLMTTTNLE
jgi:hypothetical protein